VQRRSAAPAEAFPIVGPTTGGLLVDASGWRSLFWVVVPVAVAAIGLAVWRVPETRDPGERHLDLAGQALAVVALATLALVFIEGPKLGWQSPPIVGGAIACSIAVGAFLLIEARSVRPLVPLGVFRSRPFSASILCALLMTFGIYGLLFVLPLYFQVVRHASATAAGIALLPLSVMFFLVSPLAGRLATTIGPRALIGFGMAMAGYGLLALAFITARTAYPLIAAPLAAIGIGLGLITGPIATLAVANVAAERSGMASGLVNMGRLIGATLGVAVLGALFEAQAAATATDAPQFLLGMRSTFLLGGTTELVGAAVALFWLRDDWLGIPAQSERQRGLIPR
jgi:DHA2 family methylenomycin A resistance protein-like MFS transporter